MSQEITTRSRRPAARARSRQTYDRKLVEQIRRETDGRWSELRVVSVLDWIRSQVNQAERAYDHEVRIDLGELGRAEKKLHVDFARLFPAVSRRSTKDQPTPLQNAILAAVLGNHKLQSPRIVHVRSNLNANIAFVVLHTEVWV